MLYITGGTHKGIIRAQNQDVYRSAVLSDTLGFALVCDGMGGENAGEVASGNVADMVLKYFKKSLVPGIHPNSIRELLLTAISAANAVVYDMAQKNPELSGMGTTLVCAVVLEGMAYTCHVGDSRIYVMENGNVRQLTHDHSMVQMLVDRGELSPEEAEAHPQKHYITRAVGVSRQVEPDYEELEFGPGARLLLCSDGLSNYFSDRQSLINLMDLAAKKRSAAPFIDYALESGGADNITAVLVDKTCR